MHSAPETTIINLYRYPIKGMSPAPLDSVQVEAGKCFPWDRTYAVENGGRDFDPSSPRHMPKIKFLTLMRNERLATLQTEFDAASGQMTVMRDGARVAAGKIDSKIGRQIIEQFLSAYMPDDIRGAPRIVSAEGHHFTDIEPRWLSVINLASVRDLERVLQKPVDPLRFRANIYIDGAEPWSEFDWVGRQLCVNGKAALKGMERITRCAAINVDPESGERDMAIPQALMNAFGHMDMGLYVTVTDPLTLASGDRITVSGQTTSPL